MSSIHFKDAEALQALVSDEFGDWSDAVTVDQSMINEFADLTGDHQWIHVDVAEHKTTLTLETTIHVVGQDDRPAAVYELMMVFM